MKWNASKIAALSLPVVLLYAERNYAQGFTGVQTVEPEYRNSRPGASYPVPGFPGTSPMQAEHQALAHPAPQDGFADPAANARGPSGSSASSAQRYDEVGFAEVLSVAGGSMSEGAVVGVHRTLPVNSFVEVTALETGRTILLLITGSMAPGGEGPMALSPAAARLLGYDAPRAIPVRVRRVTPTPADQAALLQGRAAAARPDTPPILINALRKHLPAQSVPVPPSVAGRPSAPDPRPAPVAARPVAPSPIVAPRPGATGAFIVQIAALSSANNAQSLAQNTGGFVKSGGGLHRVQLGPYATRAQAEQARQRVAGAGYPDARVVAN